MQKIAVAWAHVTDFQSHTDPGNDSPHYRDGPEDFMTHVDSQAAHGVRLEILRAADQDARLAEIHKIAGKVNLRR